MPSVSEKALTARLLRAGMQPADAEAVAAQAAALGAGGLTAKVLDSFGDPTASEQMRAREWWLYQAGVPDEYKRLLDAEEA